VPVDELPQPPTAAARTMKASIGGTRIHQALQVVLSGS
jgi:hypothetical protein